MADDEQPSFHDQLVQDHKRRRTKTTNIVQFPGGFKPPWWEELGKSVKGGIITDVHNVMIVLGADPRLADCFAFDEMAQVPMLMKELPLAPSCDGISGVLPRPIAKEEVGCLQDWLQYQQLRRVSFDTVLQGIELRAAMRRFHPIRDWLNSLQPHGESELDFWLQKYFGCPDDEYHRAIGRMFLIAMVARIFKPGCQADYMLVLEGDQGIVKSQACRVLASDPYFSDHLPDISGDPVRVSMALRGKWLIEISELASIKKAESEGFKLFISRQEEVYVPKFARLERREPRQCLFIGTTNTDDYLKDETGGRRSHPAKCGIIDKEGLRDGREQLFAQAVERYRHGEHWWPDRQFEAQIIAPQQHARLAVDEWTPDVSSWLSEREGPILDQKPCFTLMQIAQGALDFKKDRLGTGEQRRLTAIMKLCRWKREHTKHGNVWTKLEKGEGSEGT